MREPRTTKEHLISIYGHIEGLKKEVKNLKDQTWIRNAYENDHNRVSFGVEIAMCEN